MPVNQGFEQWLENATKGLPQRIETSVRAEFEAHYVDAVEDYLAEGNNPDQAHDKALTALGNAAEIRVGLCNTHLAERRYLTAAAIGILLPLGLVPLYNDVLGHTVFNKILLLLIVLLPAVYIFKTFNRMLVARFNFEQLNLLTKTFVYGLMAYIGLNIFTLLGYQHQVLWSSQANYPAGASLFEQVLYYAGLVVLLLLGISVILWGQRLVNLNNTLYGLRSLLRYTMLACGFLTTIDTLGFANQSFIVVKIVDPLVMLSYIMSSGLISLIFVRVVYRGSSHPAQLA